MNRGDLQRLSGMRVAEARALLDNGYFAGAYYILGYAVECDLKACIAKQTRRYDFPDRRQVADSYTHDLEKLLEVSGLKPEFQAETRRNRAFAVNWAIVEDWSEQSRYDSTISESTIRALYLAATVRRDGVLTWLRKRW